MTVLCQLIFVSGDYKVYFTCACTGQVYVGEPNQGVTEEEHVRSAITITKLQD